MSVWARLPVVLLATLVLAACSNGGGGGSNPPPAAVLEEIRLEPADAAFAAGLTLQYSAIGLYSDGSEQDLTNSVSWQSANADVARIDSSGWAQALAPGVTTILASESGIEGDTPLTVTEAEVVTVGVFPPAAQLKKGTTQDYRAFAVYSDGGIENVTFSANWSLQNDSGILAPYEPLLTRGLNSLDDFATAIAVDVGDDVIVASVAADTSDEQQGTSAISVTESELLTLRISPRSEAVLVGGTIRYEATGLYADGTAADLTKVVRWTSAEPAIIIISNAGGERGLAIAQAAGATEISATYLEIGDSTAVQVLDFGGGNPIEKIDVFPPLQSLNVGALQQYTAVAYLVDGQSIDVTQDADWSSADEAVAIISNSLETSGLVLAAGVGDTIISARFQGSTGDAALEVRAAGDSELLEIIVEPLQSTLQSFTSQQFTAIGIYEDGSKRDITGQVAWGSRDNSIIQVSNSANFGHGLALALSPGETEVTAVQQNGGSPVAGEAAVTVIEAENIPAQLLVNPPAARAIVGDNQQFTATLVLDSGVSEDVTDSVAWSSSDPAVAQIDDSGLASAESAGKTGINATLLIAGNPLSGAAILTVDGDVGIEEILVDPPLAEIIVADTQAYTAWAVLSDGTSVDITDAVSWSSSDSDVAQIRLDGVALGLAGGTTQIQALLEFDGENFSGNAQLTVKPEGNTVRSLAISPLYTKLLVGGDQQYQAEAILTDGSRVDVSEEVTWSVSDQTVAMITSGGLVQGESAGRTDIGAVLVLSYGTVNGRAILDVVEPGIVSMEVLPTRAAAVEGSSRQYSAIATLTDGSTLDVSQQAFWIALDGSVARVDQNGLAFALNEGETGVFAALEYQDQRFEGTAEFTVKASDIELSRLVVSPVSAEVLIGGTQQYSAIAYYDDGSSQDVTTISDWSTASSRVAQVDRVGLATGLFPGDTFVVARYSFRGNSEVDSGKLRVLLPPDAISDIVVSPPDGDILVGDQLQYSAQMIFANGGSVDITDLSTWESSDSEVASIGPSTGLAAGRAGGTTTISASIVLQGKSYGGNADLSVNAPPQDIVELIVSPATANILIDATQQYQAWIVLSDGTTEDVSGLVSWQSSSANVAWIDSDGLATGVSVGVVEIAATLLVDGESYSDTGQLVVEPADSPITGIVVAPADAKILLDGTQQYTATAILADGSQRDVTDLSIWESADTAIAKIDATALAIGLASGLTEITATFIHSSGTYSDSAALEVLAPPLEIEDLVVSPPAAEVLIGSSQNYTATALLSDGSSVDVTDDVSWTSSDSRVAHVDELGLATGLDEGSANITATLIFNDETFSDSGVLTVAPPSVGIEEILVTPVAAELLVGENLQYTATAILTDGSSQDVTEESDWSSSDSGVAQVNNQAIATALAAGQTEILATLKYQDETYQGSATLDVKAQDVGIESLVVDPPVASILVDTTQAYSAYVLLTDGSSHDVTDSTDWASSSPAVAAIDEVGIALGLSEGQAKITGTFLYEGVAYQNAAPLTVEDNGGVIDKLIVEPANAVVLMGGKQQYSATALFDDGSKQDVTDDAVWTSTDRDVAEINQDALATGISLGDVGIVATLLYNGQTASGDAGLAVIGDTVSVTEIVVDPPAAEVVVDSQAQYTATAILSDGSQIPVTDDVLWTSIDSGIAQVDSVGLATGLVAGATEIVATLVLPSDTFSDSGHITVKPAEATLEQLVVTPTTATVLIEGQQQYTATAKLSDGSSIDVTAVASWSSSAESIAHVSLVGLATGLAEGSSQIGAEFTLWGVSASDSGSLEVEAADIGITELVVEPTTSSILIGGEQAYSAVAVLSNGDLVDVTDKVSWTSADEAIARISTAGIATGTGEGDVAIVASLNYQDVLYQGQAALQVKAPAITVDELVVTPQFVELFNGEQQQYTATAILNDGGEIPVTDDVTWNSGNNDIAQVNSTGLATAISEGATQITATLVYAGGIISNSGDMQVTGRLVERLQIIPPYVTGPDGTQGPLIVLAAFSDGTIENVSAGAVWSSADVDIVTVVRESGARLARYSLEAPGESDITATFDGLASVIPVTVNAAELDSIVVSPSSASTPVGLDAEYTATGFYSNGDTATLTDEVVWTSSDTSVSQFTNVAGVALAVGVGTAEVSATLEGVTSFAEHVVTAAQPMEIIITPPLWSDPAGTSHAFTARAIYTDGSNADVTRQATWASTDQFVATVGNAGELAGIVNLNSPGGAAISASLESLADSASVVVTDPVVVSISVVPFGETYPELFQVQFKAIATYSNGDSPDVTDEAFWRSIDPAVAVAGEAGDVYTINSGSTLIEASFGGQIGGAPIKVVTASVTDLQVSPGFIDEPSGTRVQLEATAFYDNNQSERVTEDSVWVSGDEGIASVVTEGENAGLTNLTGVGSTTITATYQGVSRQIDVTASAAVLEKIIVQPPNATVALGLPQQYKAIGVYSDGSAGPITKGVVWASSDETRASITSGGLAQTLAPGETTISAAQADITGFTELTVSEASVARLDVTPGVDTQPAGAVTPLSVTALFTDGRVEKVTSITQWEVIEGAGANVTPVVGTLHHHFPGETVIRATLPEFADPGQVEAYLVAVTTAAALESIELTPDPLAIQLGVPGSFLATGYYSDGTSATLNAEADWTVTDPGIATVDELGEVSGIQVGTTTVTAAIGDISDTATVNVEDAVLLNIQVTPADIYGPLGSTVQLTATGYYTDGGNQDLTELVLWESSDGQIATVQSGPAVGGRLDLVAVGDALVTANLDTVISNQAVVQVTQAELLAIEVGPEFAEVPRGTTQQYWATGIYTDGARPLDKNSGLIWSSSPSLAATINQDGVATAIGIFATQATITARVDGVDGIEGSAELLVTDALITGLQVTPASAIEPAGSSLRLQAIAYYTDGSDADVTRESTWISSNTALATVVPTGEFAGLVDLLAPGDVVVTATFEGQSADSAIEVTAAELVDIIVDPPSTTLPIGLTLQYSAIGVYSDGTTSPITGQVTWESSLTRAATITPDGVAEAIARGSTQITATQKGIQGRGMLRVTAAEVQYLEVSSDKNELFEGELMQYTATAVLSDGSSKDVTRDVYWSVDPSSMAVISNHNRDPGLLQARTADSGVVMAALDQVSATTKANFSSTGSKELTVLAVTLVAIEIDDAGDTEMFPGQTIGWTARGLFSNGDETDVTATATWISSDPSLVTVEVINAVAELFAAAPVSQPEAVNISAIVGELSDTRAVAVLPLVIVDIEIYPFDPDVLAVGATQDFTAIGLLSDGSSADVTEDVDWLALDDDPDNVVAQFDEQITGRALGISVGSALIQVTTPEGDSYVGPLLEVGEKQVEGLVVFPDTLAMPKDSEWPFVALVQYSDGSSTDVSNLVQWLTTDDKVVKVSNKDKEWGLAEAKSETDAATITADWQDEGLSATAEVQTIAKCAADNDFEDKPILIEVFPDPEVRIQVGETLQLYGIGSFENKDDPDITCQQSTTTGDGHWHSSDINIVDVEHNKGGAGRILGAAPGAAQVDNEWKGVNGFTLVIVAEDSGEGESCEIEPSEQPDSIEVIPATADVKENRSWQFNAVGYYRNDTCIVDLTYSSLLEWNSDDPDICSISEQGLATATGNDKDNTSISAVYDGDLTADAECKVKK